MHVHIFHDTTKPLSDGLDYMPRVCGKVTLPSHLDSRSRPDTCLNTLTCSSVPASRGPFSYPTTAWWKGPRQGPLSHEISGTSCAMCPQGIRLYSALVATPGSRTSTLGIAAVWIFLYPPVDLLGTRASRFWSCPGTWPQLLLARSCARSWRLGPRCPVTTSNICIFQ